LVAVSALPAVIVVRGLSYPGFPMASAALLLINAVILMLLWIRWGKRVVQWRTAWVLPVTGIILMAGIGAAASTGDAPLHARWAASSAAFEAEVAVLGPPIASDNEHDGAHFGDLPGLCPSMIGRFAIGECVAVHNGYLFLQTPDAVTDSSGIAYLPYGNQPESTGLYADGLTALGGPWWAWTCNC
jgi:hypothetical protein